jgi:hypothetical protein
LLFHQRAAALLPSFHFIDPPALFFMLPCFLHSLKTLESLQYIIPCVSNLKTTVSSIGVFVIPSYICSFSFFYRFLLCPFDSRYISSSPAVRTNLRLPNLPQYVPAAFRRALDHGLSTHQLHSPSEVFIFNVCLLLLFIFSESFNHFDHQSHILLSPPLPYRFI